LVICEGCLCLSTGRYHAEYKSPFLLIYGTDHNDKKEIQIFFIHKGSGAVAKSYMRKGFLLYEEMHKYFPIYEEAVSHV
jgi:hypothetical protein